MVKCEFCQEPKHGQAIDALHKLFEVILENESPVDEEWLRSKAHLVWRNVRKAESVTIPGDANILTAWLSGLRQ
jgi:hypothetical protein